MAKKRKKKKQEKSKLHFWTVFSKQYSVECHKLVDVLLESYKGKYGWKILRLDFGEPSCLWEY